MKKFVKNVNKLAFDVLFIESIKKNQVNNY